MVDVGWIAYVSLTTGFGVAIAAALMVRSEPSPAGRIGCIDGLRGYLAFSVVAHHYLIGWNYVISGEWVAPSNPLLANLGPAAVSVFFMITGLLFYLRIDRAEVGWLKLYVGRIFRIAPLWFTAVAAVVLVSLARTGWNGDASILAPILNWIFLWGFPDIGGYSSSIVIAGVAWTLRYEALFYILLPLLALGVSVLPRHPLVRMPAFMAIAALSSTLPAYSFAGFIINFAAPFFWGMATAEALKLPRFCALLRLGPASLLGALCLTAALLIPRPAYAAWAYAPLFCFFLTVAAGNTYRGLLTARPSLVLGDVSYSIYLMQGIIIHALMVIGFPDTFSTSGTLGWAALPPTFFVLAVTSLVTYRWIERPGIALGRALTRQPKKKVGASKSEAVVDREIDRAGI
ncbi:acyltransferase [Tianweitania sp. BSSL-BM11]|uniref:Acyltransferase n=1 Tax=Tianweitania aestuarii TaxID=2814886 RepID=A0ABS5RV12_9HYPH|nr:acyltransferase [Tianweitania aestuarii]MBS9720891.1 acyltransferase [Tianweitania aestuarii]